METQLQTGLKTILENLKKWDEIRKDENDVTSVLTEYNFFTYENINVNDTEYLHAYPAISDDKLIFYVIPAKHDNKDSSEETIVKYIREYAAEFNVDNAHEIDPVEAGHRIINWNNYLNDWIKVQVNTDEGLFRAFAIPTDYIAADKPDTKFTANFALKQNQAVTAFTADLVITTTEKTGIFYDTVRPVPPFAPIDHTSPFHKEDFHLLTLSDSHVL